MTAANAPTNEIGYVNQSHGSSTNNWWMYEDETTPELRWPQSVRVYDQMRTQDAQVGSVLEAVVRPILRTTWRLDPAGARPEVVERCADDLGLPIVGENPSPPPRTKGRFSWLEHLELALLMLPFGHMFFEQTYEVAEDGSRAHLGKLSPRMPKTIDKIDVARDGGLISITQCGTMEHGTQKPIPVNRLVAYVYKKEGGNWLGRSILRQAYKNSLLKDRLLRVQAQTIERNGMGIPLYTGQEGASDASLAAGLAMARGWRSGESAGTAIPFGATLSLVGVSGTLPDAQPAIDYHDNQIARAVLAHFLNLGQQSGTGSYALGVTFADFFTASLQTLAQQIADVATQHIVEDLVDVNWGPTEPAPKITFDEIGSRQQATAQALVALMGAGALTPDDRLEQSLRQQYGLPPKQPQFLVDQPGDGPAPPPDVEAIEVQARASYPGQKWRHGWIPFGKGDKGSKAPDAPTKPSSMSDLAIELEGLEPSRQRTHMADLGYTPAEIDEVLGPDRPTSMSDLAAELEDLSPAKQRRLLKAMGFSAAEIAQLLGAPVQASQPHPGQRYRHGWIPVGGWPGKITEAVTGQDALDATPTEYRSGPRAHFGDYEGATFTVPPGAGSEHALAEYEGVEYERTNSYLRHGPMADSPNMVGHVTDRVREVDAETAARIAEIDKTMAVSPLAHDVEVSRAIKDGKATFGQAWHEGVMSDATTDFDEQDREYERWLAGDRPDLTGLTWHEAAYVSTSASDEHSQVFGERWSRMAREMPDSSGEPVIMTIRVPAGTQAIQLGQLGFTEGPGGRQIMGSAELMLQRGLTMTVVADHGVDDKGFRRLDVEVVAVDA